MAIIRVLEPVCWRERNSNGADGRASREVSWGRLTNWDSEKLTLRAESQERSPGQIGA